MTRHILLVLATATVAACGAKNPPPPAPTPLAGAGAAGAAATPTTPAPATTAPVAPSDADRRAREAALSRAAADSAAAARANAASAAASVDARTTITATIYFDYDASEIRDDARSLLESKVPVLAANPGVRIRISGHADDRGSDEYNLALGQRRAAALKRWLAQRGISEDRMLLASFGEERPVCGDADEGCFIKNRRAEFEIVAGPATLVPAK
ncbi:MAG: OmpA family protein [Gemmatimonadaceae bacterium]|nr:OmpA family protein [Gemmatimonadaceae bacterium]